MSWSHPQCDGTAPSNLQLVGRGPAPDNRAHVTAKDVGRAAKRTNAGNVHTGEAVAWTTLKNLPCEAADVARLATTSA